MEFLILLGVLGLLAAPIGLVVAIVAYRRAGRLQTEIWRLEEALREPGVAGTGRPEPSPSASARPTPPSRMPQPAPTVAPTPRPAKPAAPRPRRRAAISAPMDFEAILGGQWLTWAGILALFFGTAFFLGVDLGANPLRGLPQVLIGLGVAVVFGAVGHRLGSRPERFLGLGLLGGAVALLFLAMFAAYGFHHFVPLPVVFPLLLLVAAVGALLALNRDSLTIASLTLVGAIVTPVILVSLSADGSALDSLLPYLVAVNLGSVLVGLRRGWAGLPLASFVSSLVLVSIWWDGHPRRDLFAFLSVSGSWAVFAAAPWLQRAGSRFWSFARAGVLTANGLFYALFCHHLLDDRGRYVQGSALLVLAVVYLTLNIVMRKRQGSSPATRLSHTTGVALAALAVPVLFDLAWVTLGWTVLAGILVLTGLRERDLWQRATGLVVLVVGLFRAAFVDIPVDRSFAGGFHPLWNGEFWAGLALLGLVAWLFWAYHRYTERLHRWELRWRSSLLVVGTLVLLWKLSLELLGSFSLRQRLLQTGPDRDFWLWLLGLWSVYGLAALLIGLRSRYLPLRRPGYLIVGLAVGGTVISVLAGGVGLVRDYRLLLNLPFLQGVVLTVALLALARQLGRSASGLRPFERRLRTPLLLTAVLVLFAKVSLEVSAYFELGGALPTPNLALKSQLTLSLVWGLYAGLVIGIGFARRFKPLRLLGMFLLGLTVLKVFFVDMQSLARGYRIAAFVALGVLLLTVSLLYQRERRTQAEPDA